MGTIDKFVGVQDTSIGKIYGDDLADIEKVYGQEFNTVTPGFTFKVTTAGADTFELPINAGGAGYTQNFTVDWGDTSSSTVTAFDDADRTHSYAGAGTYTINMQGTCEWFSFNNGGDKSLVVELVSFGSDMGFKILTFYGCSNLTTIVPLGTMASLTKAQDMFSACSSLSSVPSGLFDGCVNVVGSAFRRTFASCTSITAIPSGLFDNNILAAAAEFYQTFSGCTGLETVPSLLFKHNTVASYWRDCFDGCVKLQLVSDLFCSSADEGTRFLNQSPNFTSCFERGSFSGTQGTAPDLWNYTYGTGTPTSSSCYSGAGNSVTSLDNYGDIPAGWK